MNKRGRKTNGLSHRLIALLLCCVCLVTVLPLSAIALAPDETAAAAEEIAPEEPTVDIAEEPETPDAEESDTEPEEDSSEQHAVDALYRYLMACTSYEEMDAAINALSEDELYLMDQFTAEQNAALEARMQELGGYASDVYTDRSVSIEQGGSQTVSISNMATSKDFSYSCTQSGITATQPTTSGYTISVDSSVPAGSSYDLTVNYYTWSWSGLSVKYTSHSDAVTVKVTRSGNYLTVINNMTNVDVVYVKIENNEITDKFTPVTSGSAMEMILSDNDAIVFFVKPQDGYLLTQFYREERGDVDLYSVNTTAANCNIGYFKSHPDTGDDILSEAKDKGYLGYYGFTGPSSSYTGTFVEVAEAPQMSVTATANPSTDLKPGDKVTFTIKVTPGDLSTGANYTVTDSKITNLTINGVLYEATENTDGTYSVNYTITEEDWMAKKATLDVTASLTYNYETVVTDRNETSGKIHTTATITSNATTDCTFATKQGVWYMLSYDAPSGVNPPDSTIPAAPVEDEVYFEGNDVPVRNYNRSDVDDPVNKGTWTFTGWTNGDETNLKTGNTVKMTKDGLLFTGVWTFTPYPNANLTITKTLSGNMYNEKDEFEFTVTYDGETETFSLGNNKSNTLSIPVGAEVTISEAPDGYKSSLTNSTLSGLKDEWENDQITFTMPAENVAVTINNEKTITIDAGVVVSTLPYVLMLAVVVGGVTVTVKRRKHRREN